MRDLTYGADPRRVHQHGEDVLVAHHRLARPLEHRLQTPEGRIARSLATLFNPQLYPGVGRRFRLSQEEIGYLSGVARQRANQALRVLEGAKLLRIEYGGVTVLDVEGLNRYDG